jgi:hypothetical protein
MGQKLLLKIEMLAFLLIPLIPLFHFGQSPTLGTAADFVLFSSVGAVTNTSNTHLTGNVGTNSGSSTGFGNVDGVMHDGNGTSAQCAADLVLAYNELNSTVPDYFPASLLGNGQILTAGIYTIPSTASLNLNLILDAQNDPNAVFIFKIEGAFSSAANSEISLVNGAQACKVFWKVEGLVDLATGTKMKGTIVANNAGININTGAILEGRALSTTGAISVDGILAYKPIGCGSSVLNGPAAPDLNSAICYAIFSSNGSVTNAGVTFVTGDVGTNVGLTTGFDEINVTGEVHPIPDTSTADAANDLLIAYNYLNLLPYDIELLYPAQFGNDLVLTPHTYLLNAATVVTNTVYLNAQNNPDAVFVIKINGALSTSTYAKVLLLNGAQAKNVYWKIEGAIAISDYSEFKGTIIGNNGAIDLLTGVQLDGRAMTTTGALSTAAVTVTMTEGCETLGVIDHTIYKKAVIFYPNPFNNVINLILKDTFYLNNAELSIYDVSGREIYRITLSNLNMQLDLSNLSSGTYFYKINSSNKTIQFGGMVAK